MKITTIAAAALLAMLCAAAADHQATCEGKLVFGHGILIILPRDTKGECDLSRLAYTDEADDTKRDQVFKKVTAVCGEPKKWATPHHCKISGLAIHASRIEEAEHGAWCLEFTTIDTVIR